MRKLKNIQSNQDKLVDDILEKLRSGRAGQEINFYPESQTKTRTRRNSVSSLPKKKDQSASNRRPAVSPAHFKDEAQEFIESMNTAEETCFDQMMGAVSAETERERVENLRRYLKQNRASIPNRLVANLRFFPSLLKYYLLADTDHRLKPRPALLLNQPSLRLLPTAKLVRARISGLKIKRQNEKFKRRLRQRIKREFYLDIKSPSGEEKEAIENLLEISSKFRQLYEEYKKIK
ncbi:MAG: hypothetical protein ACOZBH_01895 [Patescibacteria group bacterium]